MNTSKTNSHRIRTAIVACCVGLSASAATAQDLKKLSDANTGFAFDLLKQIASEQINKNIFISPFSVSSVLQMVANGAAGETKSEMLATLKTAGVPAGDLNPAFKELNTQLAAQKDATLNLANGLWVKQGFQLKPAFVADNKKYFQAELAGVDFDKPESAKTINDWADRQTKGKIKDVVQFPFPPLTRLILANAIYFKGKWTDSFDTNRTRPFPFHLPGGEAKQTPMMWQHKHFSYQEGNGFQAVRLPYRGGRLQMMVFLPATNSSLRQLVENCDNETWRNNALQHFEDKEGTLLLPKFKLEYDVLLNDPLKALGMKRAFESKADFSGIASEPLFISEVKQKSFVDVNEEGTEAAAVTTVRMTLLSARPVEPFFEMIVDRPFLFLISDQDTGTVLFSGLVNEPKGDAN